MPHWEVDLGETSCTKFTCKQTEHYQGETITSTWLLISLCISNMLQIIIINKCYLAFLSLNQLFDIKRCINIVNHGYFFLICIWTLGTTTIGPVCLFTAFTLYTGSFPGGSVAKNLPAMQEMPETWDSVPSLGRSLGEGNGTHSSILA